MNIVSARSVLTCFEVLLLTLFLSSQSDVLTTVQVSILSPKSLGTIVGQSLALVCVFIKSTLSILCIFIACFVIIWGSAAEDVKSYILELSGICFLSGSFFAMRRLHLSIQHPFNYGGPSLWFHSDLRADS